MNPRECDYSPGQLIPITDTPEIPLIPAVNVTIDGLIQEPIWSFSDPLTFAVHDSQTDVTTALVQALGDLDHLYPSFNVADTQVETATPEAPWDGDGISAVFKNEQVRCRQDVEGTGEGFCDRAVHLPPRTSIKAPQDIDCGFTIEMPIHWAALGMTANVGDTIPADLLSVDHDRKPGAPYNAPDTEFPKLSWDGGRQCGHHWQEVHTGQCL